MVKEAMQLDDTSPTAYAHNLWIRFPEKSDRTISAAGSILISSLPDTIFTID